MTAADHGQIDPARAESPPVDRSARIDSAVIASLYERYADELGLFLKGVLRNSDLAAEALQNTFTKAVESGHTAREESLKGWLFRVAFHEAALLRRRGQIHDRSLRQIARNSQSSGDSGERPEERLGPIRNIVRSSTSLARASARSATGGSNADL